MKHAHARLLIRSRTVLLAPVLVCAVLPSWTGVASAAPDQAGPACAASIVATHSSTTATFALSAEDCGAPPYRVALDLTVTTDGRQVSRVTVECPVDTSKDESCAMAGVRSTVPNPAGSQTFEATASVSFSAGTTVVLTRHASGGGVF